MHVQQVSPSRHVLLCPALFAVVPFTFCSYALPQTPPDTAIARTYVATAEQLAKQAEYDSSGFYFEKAAAIYKRSGDKLDDPKVWEKLVHCYNRLGTNLRKQEAMGRALESLNRALEIGTSKLGQQNLNVATTYHELGIVYRSKGDYDRALGNFHRSLQARLKLVGELSPLVASSYNSLGNVYRAKGDYDNALEYYRDAMEVARKTLEEGHPSFSAFYNNLGIAYYDKGDYDRALEYFHKSLSIELKTRGDKHPSIGSDYNNIANVYHDKGDYRSALEFHKKAFEARLHALGENHTDVAESYFNMARAELALGDFQDALDYHLKALAIERQAFGEKHFLVAESYLHIGNVYFEKGGFDKALEYYQQALPLQLETLGDGHPDVALTYQQIGKVYGRQDHPRKALAFFQKSIMTLVPGFHLEEIHANPELKNVRKESYLLGSLILKAEALTRLSKTTQDPAEKRNCLESSLVTSTLASQLMEKARRGYREEGSKLLLTGEFAGLYPHAIQTALELFDVSKEERYRREAFFFMEKGKSAVLREALQESQARRFAGIPDSLVAMEKRLRIDLAFYETEIQTETEKNETERDTEKIREFQDRFFALNRSYDQLVERFERDFPDYYNLKYQTRVATLTELQNAVDGSTALLEYSLGDSTLYIATITREAFEVARVPIDSSFFSSVQVFCKSLKTADPEDYLLHGAGLYDTILRPVGKLIANKRRLVIAPDGILHHVPFDALVDGQAPKRADFRRLNYLIRRYEISYQYSATLFMNQQPHLVTKVRGRALSSKQPEAAFEPARGFMGFAPVFAGEGGTLDPWLSNAVAYIKSLLNYRSVTVDGKTFNALKYSEDEVKEIAALFERKHSIGLGFYHGDASERNFKANAGRYKYVHVATHGLFNEERPELSGLIFSRPADSTVAEDGILYSAECYNLDLNADLVVLSSCESGAGLLMRGEGLMALARGFLYSGARNIIHSLWKIEDKHTSKLMIELYKNVLDGRSFADALRQAKLKLIENEATAFPGTWSSFVLIGG